MSLGQHHNRHEHYQEASDLLSMAVQELRNGGDSLDSHDRLVARANVHAILATAPDAVEQAAHLSAGRPRGGSEVPAADPRTQHGVHCPAAYSAGVCTYTDGCVVKYTPSAFPGVPPIRRYADGTEEYGPYTPPPAGSGWPGADATIWAANEAHATAIKKAYPQAADRVQVRRLACGETTPDGPCDLAAGHPSYPGAPGHNGHMANVPAPPDVPLPVDELEDQGSPDLSLAALNSVSTAMHDMVASWSTGQRGEHDALEHGSHPRGEECWLNFHLEDIHRLIDDAVRELAHNPARPTSIIAENAHLRQALADVLPKLAQAEAGWRTDARQAATNRPTEPQRRRLDGVLAATSHSKKLREHILDRLSRADITLPDPTPED